MLERLHKSTAVTMQHFPADNQLWWDSIDYSYIASGHGTCMKANWTKEPFLILQKTNACPSTDESSNTSQNLQKPMKILEIHVLFEGKSV